MLLAACGGGAAAGPTPRAVDLTTIADADLVAAVLDECHRPLRGRLDRIAAIVGLPGGDEVRLFAELPDKLRALDATGSWLLLHDEVRRLGGDDTQPVAAADADRVRRLRTLLDGALLGPLHRARGCRRIGPVEWELPQPDGSTARVALRPGTLLPDRVVGGHGEVRCVDYLRTSTTWMVQRAALDGLGECTLQFVVDDLAWAPDFFTAGPRDAVAPASGATTRLAAATGEARSPVPFVVDAAATNWVVVADPGTWPARCERYAPLHAELLRQDQQVAGFPILWQEDDAAWLAAPFRRRPEGPAFRPPTGWTIRAVPAGRWLVVYPPEGDFAARRADGERRLREALPALRLTARGAVITQPFLHLQEGEPPVDKLAAPVLRMSLPVQ
ncbi:MAG: hypothetical protein JNM25_18345 [Planctomycetes bacterium]|nr:hypothetical protein [Planctomycetota bacterium]